MVEKYSKDELWDIYEKLPSDLKEAVFSPETANYINTICGQQEVKEEKISEVARLTGRVLMGLLKPSEFKKVLEEKLNLGKEKAENVFRGINRFIFNPVRETLEALYGVEISPLPKPEGLTKKVKQEPKEEKPKKKDVYREPIKEK